MVQKLSFQETGFFSKTAIDYSLQKENIASFHKHSLSWEGFANAIATRKQFPQNRAVLVQEIKTQYQGLELTEKVKENIALLSESNTFTITTAHQPNIFTGPLYFLYKILHVAKLATEAKAHFPNENFVPVYYMGSEDADIDEIGQFTVQGKKYIWATKQTGAVGRMKVDKPLLQLLKELEAQISNEPFGNELLEIFKSAYSEGKTIQQATLEIVNSLFGKFGIIVIIPDNPALKKLYEPVIIKELEESFSHKIVARTSSELEAKGYKQQATGRDINLFYLLDDKRERIEKEGDFYFVKALDLQFSKDEIIAEVKAHPERFSGNVILRGPFQETILPNVCFVGGGGELAYWLELKNIYDEISVPYPLLMLRNSYMLMSPLEMRAFEKLNIHLRTLFLQDFEILDYITTQKDKTEVSLEPQRVELKKVYKELASIALLVDKSLQEHTEALLAKADKKISLLEKKIKRAKRQQATIEKGRINYLKQNLFPKGSLQERVENIALIYPKIGSHLLDLIYTNANGLPSAFIVCDYQ